MNTLAPSTTYAYWKYSAAKATVNHRYLWPAVLRQLPQPATKETLILDAGCGSGAFCKVLSDLGYKVFGCELSESGIALARDVAPECCFERLSVYDDLVEPFKTRFDVVVSVEVVEHLYDPPTFISRVRAAIRPGGILILTTPYHGYWKNLLIALFGKCDSHYNPLNTGGHVKFWSRQTITTLLERGGFRVEGFSSVGRLPWLGKSMVLVARPIDD